jgi:hypothetical protein
LFSSKEFRTPQQQKQSKDDRQNAYSEVEPTLPVVVDDDFCDLDKFVSTHLEKKSKKRNFRQQPSQPETAAAAPTAPAAPAQEPAPAPRAKCGARIMKRRTFVNPITGPTVKLSTKRSQHWWMTNEENDDGYNEMDRSRSNSRMKMCTDEEYFKEIAEIAFPIDEFLKKACRSFNKEKPPASSVPCHEEEEQQRETIIVETVADGNYTYMSPPKNIDEAQKQIDSFDNFQDKEAIWNYIESAWEDDYL